MTPNPRPEKLLLAIDWGTSSLRGVLLDGANPVSEERRFERGILTVEPVGFPQVFEALFGDWMRQARLCLMSGMVGSRQGWREAAYCACPAGLSEVAGHLLWLEPGRLAIVPGLCCRADELGRESALGALYDVLRGEETQVFGALRMLARRDALLLLPGTHSKWVRVSGERIVSFATFMTGEFYALLRHHSILARTLPEAEGATDDEAFLLGVRAALRGKSLLNTAFSARTVALFDQIDAHRRADYLSGLVIGDELRAQAAPGDAEVIVVGDEALNHRYRLALAELGVSARCIGSEATWNGLAAIAGHITLSEQP